MRVWKCVRTIGVVTAVVIAGMGLPVARAAADAPAPGMPPGLAFAEIKMTGDEFLVLTNNSAEAIPDLNVYWLYNYNKTDPQTAGATTTTQQLPATPLGPGASLLLSDGGATCGAQAAAKLSISLGDSAGDLQLLSSTPEGLVLPVPIDQVSWGTSASPSITGDIPSVPASSKDKQAVFYRTQNGGAFAWTIADVAVDDSGYANICQLNVTAGGSTGLVAAVDPTDNQLLPPGEAPATIVSLAANAENTSTAHLPPGDIGLAGPQITELLPNPVGTGTDSADEFIELYNSNTAPFDLSGFTLETGLTTKHKYVFPDRTLLPAKSFKAFYSLQTGLTLSNTSGAADLLDPFGNTVFQANQYGSAKDGQAWALAKGTWYWTLKLTPGAANVINQTTAGKTASAKKTTAVKGAATTKHTSQSGSAATDTTGDDSGSPAPLHPLILAVVIALAIGYGVYEYRHDLGNAINRLRTNRTARRKARAQPARW